MARLQHAATDLRSRACAASLCNLPERMRDLALSAFTKLLQAALLEPPSHVAFIALCVLSVNFASAEKEPRKTLNERVARYNSCSKIFLQLTSFYLILEQIM